MSSGVIVMMGDCILYLGTKYVSYFLTLSLLDSKQIMLKADKYIKPQRQSAKHTAYLGHAKPHLHG
jgi:hypothetical protein